MDAAGTRTGNTTAARISTSLALLGIVAVSFVCVFRPLRDFDLPWNLATGRWLTQLGSVPSQDDLAFTKGTLRYLELLGDILLYQSWQWGGAWGLQVVGALAALVLLGTVLQRSWRSGPVAYLAVAGVACGAVVWFEVRPATLSFAAFGILLWLLEEHRMQPERRWPLVALVPLQIVWANTHGFAALGAAWIVGYVAHRGLARVGSARLTSWFPERDGGHLLATAAWGGFAVLATSASTAGPELLLGPFRFDEKLEGITEWAVPTVHFFLQQQPVGAAVVLLSTFAFLLGRESNGSRVPCAFDAGQAVLALGGAFTAVRLLPIAVIVLVPLAARRSAHAVRRTDVMWLACALAPPLAAGWLAISLPLSKTPGFDDTWHPVHAADFILEAQPRGQMYNFMPFGGYLMWRLYPEYRVFNDGRNQLARSAEFTLRAKAASRDPGALAQMLAEFHVEWAVERSPAEEGFGAFFTSAREWRMVYWDDVATVYVRSGGDNRELASAGYQLFHHLIPLPQVLQLALSEPGMSAALVHDGKLAALQAPDSARAAFLEACAGIAARSEELTGQAILRLAALSPEHPAIAVLQQAWQSLPGFGAR